MLGIGIGLTSRAMGRSGVGPPPPPPPPPAPPPAPPGSPTLYFNGTPKWADAGVTPAVDGGTVWQWDLSPSGSMSQSTSTRRPTFRASGLAAGPCLETDGGDFLTGPSVSIDRRNFTLALACYAPTTTGTIAPFGTPDNFNFYLSGGGGWNLFDGSANRTISGGFTPLGLNLLILRGTAGNITLWQGGSETAYGQVSTSSGVAATAGTLTNTFTIFGSGTSFPLPAGWQIAGGALYPTALSDSTSELLMTWMREQFENPPGLQSWPRVLVSFGNSLTFGVGAGVAANRYTEQAIAVLGSSWRHTVQGWPGIRTPELRDGVHLPRATRFSGTTGRTQTVYVVWEVTNHLRLGSATAAAAYASVKGLCEDIKAADPSGKVIILGCIAREGISGFGDSTNALIAADFPTATTAALTYRPGAGVTWADLYVALKDDSRMQNSSNTTFFGDTIHLTPAGYALVGGWVAGAVGVL